MGLFSLKTMSKHFLKNPRKLWKTPGNDSFDPQKWYPKTVKWANLNNLIFLGHLSTFGSDNKPKSRPLKVENNPVENNPQLLPKQLIKNFEKVQKMTFLTPKCHKTSVDFAESVDFWINFRSTGPYFVFWVFFRKSFP